MTYTQAKLRIWSWEAYTPEQVREAAIFILASLSAHQEDIDQALSVI